MTRLVLLVLTTLLAGPALADKLRLRRDVKGVDQPGGARLKANLEGGAEYEVVKRGGPADAWCKVKAGSVEAWIRCDEGETSAVTPRPAPPERTPDGATCARTCSNSPLFPVDFEFAPVEREVLALCPAERSGEVGGDAIRRFALQHVGDAPIRKLLAAAGRMGQGSDENARWIAAIWDGPGRRNAFTHVFCGDEWESTDLGGLHWLPRFAQLEHDGKICFGGAAKGGRVAKVGAQYLVKYAGLAPWSCGRKSFGGFSERRDPVELLALGTRAFVRCCDRGQEGGVFRAKDVAGAWRVWCGKRNGSYGLASFYPTDERPTCAE